MICIATILGSTKDDHFLTPIEWQALKLGNAKSAKGN
jgi:hypothetical protein